MKKTQVRCTMPVQIYDEGLTGVYQPGQILEGSQAEQLLQLYPMYFEPVFDQE